MLPVEVEVLEAASLFLSREILDFGILKSGGLFVACVCICLWPVRSVECSLLGIM